MVEKKAIADAYQAAKADMSGPQFTELKGLLEKFFTEESEEPEHAKADGEKSISEQLREAKIVYEQALKKFSDDPKEIRIAKENYNMLVKAIKSSSKLDAACAKLDAACRKDADGKKIELFVNDEDNQLGSFLAYVKKISGVGHSFIVVVDPDDSEYRKKFSFDGDGAFSIQKIIGVKELT
jgi:hypothetical protein